MGLLMSQSHISRIVQIESKSFKWLFIYSNRITKNK